MRQGWLMLLAALALAGCVRTHTTDFALAAPQVQSKSAWAQAAKVTLSVSDKRVDRTSIGLTHVAGGDKFIVQANGAIDSAVAKGIRDELQARGVLVFDGPAYLLVDIVKAECQTSIAYFSVNVAADAAFDVQVVGSDGRVHYRQTYQRSEAGKGEVWTFNSVGQGAIRLQQVMAGLVHEMMDDDRLVQALLAAS